MKDPIEREKQRHLDRAKRYRDQEWEWFIGVVFEGVSPEARSMVMSHSVSDVRDRRLHISLPGHKKINVEAHYGIPRFHVGWLGLYYTLAEAMIAAEKKGAK